MTYSYDNSDKEFYEEVWDILVEYAGASEKINDKDSFVYASIQIEHPYHEYRFCGNLGFGGKFWRTSGQFYISCYPEDETVSSLETISKVNKTLRELAEKYKPKTY